jgi:demethylmenaquinone methyltransferase/2-methoxy-6-polyprenyl-1,4-benzoquinol methylase
MMQVGQQRGDGLDWTAADALHLPFADQSFDAIVSGYLLRNVTDLPRALAEMYRVLKPDGRWVALDTTRPQPNIFSPLIKLYLKYGIPWLGTLITGQRDAYTYLPASTQAFLTAEALAEALALAGFGNIAFVRRMFGTMAIHRAEKRLE